MGCDLIQAGSAYVGYKVPYKQVFRISGREKIYFNAEMDEDFYNYIRLDWSTYLLESHPDIVPYKLGAFAGCESKPGSYESVPNCEDCFVVFGYKVYSESLQSTEDGDEIVSNLSSYKFPKTLPQIIGGFIEYLHTRRKKRQYIEEPRRKISVRFDMARLTNPELVTTLDDKYHRDLPDDLDEDGNDDEEDENDNEDEGDDEDDENDDNDDHDNNEDNHDEKDEPDAKRVRR